MPNTNWQNLENTLETTVDNTQTRKTQKTKHQQYFLGVDATKPYPHPTLPLNPRFSLEMKIKTLGPPPPRADPDPF